MTREELVLKVAQGIACHSKPDGAAMWDANMALTTICAALGISDAALDALAKGEACVVPREPTEDMDRAALEREYQGADDDLYHSIYRAMVSASPYAARDAEGGA